MLKFWALFALMTFAVKSAHSVKRWTYYKAEYTNKEKRCLRGTCELGPYAYRGTTFQGPAWSLSFFFDDPELYTESPWYTGIRGEAQLTEESSTRLVDILHKEDRIIRSPEYESWDERGSDKFNSNDDVALGFEEEDPDLPAYEEEDEDVSHSFQWSDNRLVRTGISEQEDRGGGFYALMR